LVITSVAPTISSGLNVHPESEIHFSNDLRTKLYISWGYLHERWQRIRERIEAKKIRPTVQLEIIEATRATFKEIFVEKLATKKDHLIKQYINF